MNELKKKVFKTLFILLSLFLFVGICIYNISSYTKEYDNVKRNLTFMEDRSIKPEGNPPEPKEFDNSIPEPKDRTFDNMMIMDYEVYSVFLNNGTIERIINHGNDSNLFDVESIAKSILSKEKGLKIGNLYFTRYAYQYSNDTITIIHTESIQKRLLITFLESIVLFAVFDSIAFFLSKVLTKRITKPAEEAFEKQRDFIADASHELKTPLAVIMASSDELKSNKSNEKYVHNIKYESERMNHLIKNLLDLSKLEKGISIQNYKDENLSKIIEKISLTFESIAFEEHVTIQLKVEDNMILHCCGEEIERLISIILDNAIKHSYENSSILVRAFKDKNTIVIEITNEGDPIKSGDEEKIFERFYRGDKSRNRDSNRYGLGLAIAKNIVTNHHGTIKAYSKEHLTTFKIIFKK